MEFFGYTFTLKKKAQEVENHLQTLTEPVNVDGSMEVTSGSYGAYALGIDLVDVNIKNEAALISQYRDMAVQPELDIAIDDVVNEVFGAADDEMPIKLNLDLVKIPASTKKKIIEEFDYILELLDFRFNAYEIFKHWYVDGRLFYHKIIDETAPRKGIQELRYIDPRKIKKVRQRRQDKTIKTIAGVPVNQKFYEYFVYNPRGINFNDPNGVKITTESIAFIHSGLMDKTNSVILSYLHKAIKPLNQLRMLEDATVIYKMTRAPERRIFNVEIGDLPKGKAEQHMKDTINRFKNKIVYDVNTGEVKNSNKFMTMLEDFWFPKRDGKGTTVETLPGSSSFAETDSIDYFKKKLYKSLNVPTSRLEENSQFNLGRSSEITRDEIKFAKFVTRLRRRFSGLFDDILGTQLILKGIVTRKEWEVIQKHLFYDYVKDNMFAELKDIEIWSQRLQTYRDAKDLIEDKMLSRKWVRQNILRITDDEYREIETDIELEKEDEEDSDDSEVDFDDDKPKMKPYDHHAKTIPDQEDAEKDDTQESGIL